MTDAKHWIIQRCTQRRRPAECVGGFELIYEDFDVEPVTEERMQAKLKMLSNSDEEFQRHNVANCRCPGMRILNGSASLFDADQYETR